MTAKWIRFAWTLAAWLVAAEGAAQHGRDTSLPDVTLDSVTVTARRAGGDDVNVGARVSSIGQTVLEGNRTRSLSELLSDNTTVYIKTMGQGAFSVASFRGTTSSQTQVNWNGININPVMSTSFDFSKIPVFFADNVTLYHGNSHFKNGTGALGGSINIANTPSWQDSTRLRAFAEFGSFGMMTAAAAVRAMTERSLFQTRVYFQRADGDFRYLNKVLKKNPFYDRRKEAAYQQSGVMQEAYFKTGRYGMISTNLWFQYGNRRLPQPIIVNVTNHERQQDSGLKYLLGYEYEKGKHTFSVRGAYLLDVLDYEKWADNGYSDQGSLNYAHTLTVKGEYRYVHSPRWEFGASVSFAHEFAKTRTDTSGYTQQEGFVRGKKDFRVDRDVLAVQANALWRPVGRLTLNGQVMGELNDVHFAPTFSFGAALPLVDRRLTAKANAAYNYRFPSLNDLYWYPGGNPDLRPEKGFSYDATLTYTPKIGKSVYVRIEATYYVMKIDDMIMWLYDYGNNEGTPGGDNVSSGGGLLLRPRNMHHVLSHGLELLGEINWIAGDLRAKLSVNYAYSPSYNRRRNFEEDATYKSQLPYIPLHKANARLRLDYKNAYLTYQTCYTGIRYTNDDETYWTNAYTIHDAEAGYRFRFGRRGTLTPSVRVSNLFDAYYESTEYYPMPLRNILGSVTFTF